MPKNYKKDSKKVSTFQRRGNFKKVMTPGGFGGIGVGNMKKYLLEKKKPKK